MRPVRLAGAWVKAGVSSARVLADGERRGDAPKSSDEDAALRPLHHPAAPGGPPPPHSSVRGRSEASAILLLHRRADDGGGGSARYQRDETEGAQSRINARLTAPSATPPAARSPRRGVPAGSSGRSRGGRPSRAGPVSRPSWASRSRRRGRTSRARGRARRR